MVLPDLDVPTCFRSTRACSRDYSHFAFRADLVRFVVRVKAKEVQYEFGVR